MHRSTLNIGMRRNDNGELLDLDQVLEEVLWQFQWAGSYLLTNSETEPTLVIQVFGTSRQTTRDRVFRLSVRLKQDCIAVQHDDGAGYLIGPDAIAWGEFDKSKFITMEVAQNG